MSAGNNRWTKSISVFINAWRSQTPVRCMTKRKWTTAAAALATPAFKLMATTQSTTHVNFKSIQNWGVDSKNVSISEIIGPAREARPPPPPPPRRAHAFESRARACEKKTFWETNLKEKPLYFMFQKKNVEKKHVAHFACILVYDLFSMLEICLRQQLEFCPVYQF